MIAPEQEDSFTPDQYRACTRCHAELLVVGDEMSCPFGHPVVGWSVVSRDRHRVVAKVVQGEGKERRMRVSRSETAPVRTVEPIVTPGDKVKTKTVDRAKFRGPKQVLFVRLIHATALGRFRVRWETEPLPGRDDVAPSAAYLSDSPTLDGAQAAYKEALSRAQLMGWQRVPVRGPGAGGRTVTMKELPRPSGTAA